MCIFEWFFPYLLTKKLSLLERIKLFFYFVRQYSQLIYRKNIYSHQYDSCFEGFILKKHFDEIQSLAVKQT